MERKQASDYPQELLDLFHEYQHGDITRRDFLDRAGKFFNVTDRFTLRPPVWKPRLHGRRDTCRHLFQNFPRHLRTE